MPKVGKGSIGGFEIRKIENFVVIVVVFICSDFLEITSYLLEIVILFR